jgi:predicted TIM-barrel fold metal-dependent hydrolase
MPTAPAPSPSRSAPPGDVPSLAPDFRAFDADNHYYEAEDAFTRHMDRRLAKSAVQWAVVNGRKRLVVCGRIDRFIPNPTFDPVAKPGSLDEYFRGHNPEGKDMRALFGELEPIHPEYRDRDARLRTLDAQRLEAALLFPTQGVGIEEPMRHSAELTHATLEAFNRWLLDDWGFAYGDRLFAAPMFSLMDVDRAVHELEWALAHDARVIHLRAAPVPRDGGSRSPADPCFDPFWARVDEAGITVAFHAGDSGYGRYAAAWEDRTPYLEAFRGYAFGQVTQAGRAIYDTFASLIIHGLFRRHPRVRVCSIENGSEWVPMLLKKLAKAHGQMPWDFAEDPVETFKRHIWVAPYYEDDIRALADRIGPSQVLMGSDWPHAEGLADPIRFVEDLRGFGADEVRMVMRDNARRLVTPGAGPAAHR